MGIGQIIGEAAGDLFGNWMGARANEKAAHENANLEQFYKVWDYEKQKEFAQHGIRWKVEDAQSAGIHPLAALGVMPSSYSGGPTSFDTAPDAKMKAMSEMGQNLSRSARASMTPEERELQNLQIRRLRAQVRHDEIAADAATLELVRRTREDQMSPGMPGQVKTMPDVKISPRVDDTSVTAGKNHPGYKEYSLFPGWGDWLDKWNLLYSQEGPAESLEGVGALGAALVRKFLYEPDMALRRRLLNYRSDWKKSNPRREFLYDRF